jgi:hypothetical protein
LPRLRVAVASQPPLEQATRVRISPGCKVFKESVALLL